MHAPRTQDPPARKRLCARRRSTVLLCPVSGSGLLLLREFRGPSLFLLRCLACLQLRPEVFLLHRGFLFLQCLERLELSVQAFLQLRCQALLLLESLSCPGSLPLLRLEGVANFLLRCLPLLLCPTLLELGLALLLLSCLPGCLLQLECPMLLELGLALLLLSFVPGSLLQLEGLCVLRQLLLRSCPCGLGLAELVPQLPKSVVNLRRASGARGGESGGCLVRSQSGWSYPGGTFKVCLSRELFWREARPAARRHRSSRLHLLPLPRRGPGEQ